MKRVVAVLGTLVVSSVVAQADSLVTVRPLGSDTVSWTQLGSSFTPIPNSFSFTTGLGVSGTGSYATPGPGEVRVQGDGWAGSFAPGESVNWNSGRGALTLSFAEGYRQIGAQIDADFAGPLTAQICDVNGCFREDGVSTHAGDDSALYIGIVSDSPISSVTFSLTSASFLPEDFAINRVTLNGDGPTDVTPEPSSLVLLGTAVAGALGVARRRLTAG